MNGSERLREKTAVITGGAQGIGRAMAETFAREGARLILADVDGALAEKTAAEVAAAFNTAAHGVACNVTEYPSCEAAVAAAVDKFGKIDILVNNAGITRDGLVLRMSDADWDAVLAVNLKGAFHCTKAALRPMMKARTGRIINIASVIGQQGNAGQANYAASKGGLIAFTKSCAKEVASRGILVNAIAPGFIQTRMTDAISEEAKSRALEFVLLGRMGKPEEVAAAALFLASDDAAYITGQGINVNGGMYV